MNDQEAHEFYSNPEHLRPAGSWARKRAWPRIDIRYEPPSCGPQAQTLNMGSQPYWVKNPESPA